MMGKLGSDCLEGKKNQRRTFLSGRCLEKQITEQKDVWDV